jgi:hypothetical protein
MISMVKRASDRDWLPLARTEGKASEVPTGESFRPEWIDFERGIRVGNLEPHERITRILKHRLEEAFGTGFVTDRWGRGVYWQWICWLPRADRDAKPVSHDVNFGCAKLYISVDRTLRVFQCGCAVERGVLSGRPSIPGILNKPDWDWHRLIKGCAVGSPLEAELRRLVVREGFTARIMGAGGSADLTAANYRGARQVRDAARKAAPGQWAGVDVFYPMTEADVKASTGFELVQGILGAFSEVVPFMNLCMQVRLTRA